jgi:hypothetical protein
VPSEQIIERIAVATTSAFEKANGGVCRHLRPLLADGIDRVVGQTHMWSVEANQS